MMSRLRGVSFPPPPHLPRPGQASADKDAPADKKNRVFQAVDMTEDAANHGDPLIPDEVKRAADRGDESVVLAWIAASGRVNASYVNGDGLGGFTLLMAAASNGQESLIDTLLRCGAVVDQRLPGVGLTALCFAAARDDFAIMRRLLEAGASMKIASETLKLCSILPDGKLRRTDPLAELGASLCVDPPPHPPTPPLPPPPPEVSPLTAALRPLPPDAAEAPLATRAEAVEWRAEQAMQQQAKQAHTWREEANARERLSAWAAASAAQMAQLQQSHAQLEQANTLLQRALSEARAREEAARMEAAAAKEWWQQARVCVDQVRSEAYDIQLILCLYCTMSSR